MTERSNLISKLQSDFKTRAAYIHAKVSTLVPSQIKGLRLKSDMPRQKDLAQAAELHQSRISMFETPGANPTVETLSAIAAALKVGLKIEFVPFSEMLAWENEFSQDGFNPTRIDEDQAFLNPPASNAQPILVPITIPMAAQPVTYAFDVPANVAANAEAYWGIFGPNPKSCIVKSYVALPPLQYVTAGQRTPPPVNEYVVTGTAKPITYLFNSPPAPHAPPSPSQCAKEEWKGWAPFNQNLDLGRENADA